MFLFPQYRILTINLSVTKTVTKNTIQKRMEGKLIVENFKDFFMNILGAGVMVQLVKPPPVRLVSPVNTYLSSSCSAPSFAPF